MTTFLILLFVSLILYFALRALHYSKVLADGENSGKLPLLSKARRAVDFSLVLAIINMFLLALLIINIHLHFW